ncbi:L-Aspartase-like protein [Aspergillus pseudotamarii]|uniref:L-Aspartase-like protein n=1 Tax=Aspergillus pseudotamarii TaxID=132259 RepID=A0A5N6SC15_ASPPS|nr:L-Aspartase-like protein [Aspergillus pseudotamarii]KAE8130943.1 L-Aspartase-like protein [Aspergillus pseudotamarii]
MSISVLDSRIFRNLFGTEEVREIFTDEAYAKFLVQTEAALARAESKVNAIPAEVGDAITAVLGNIELELSRETEIVGYPVLPLVMQLVENTPEDLSKYIHWGATTQDVMDNASMLQIKRGLDLVKRDLNKLIDILQVLAETYRDTPMAGRTHLQHALPCTFGYKCAVYLSSILRHRDRLCEIERRCLLVQFGGAAGTLASLGSDRTGILVRAQLAKELELEDPMITWHVARDNIAEVLNFLALIGGTLGKIGLDIIVMSSNELDEVAEPFVPHRGASSTMPQKRNPISSEIILAASKLLRANASLGLDAMVVDFERLCVKEDSMERNLHSTRGLIVGEAVMMGLAPFVGRQRAHDVVYEACKSAIEHDRVLLDVLKENMEVSVHLNEAQLTQLCDPLNYLGSGQLMVDDVLKRVAERKAGLKAILYVVNNIKDLLLVVCPAFILFGYNQSNLGGLVSVTDFTNHFPRIDTVHTEGKQKSANATIQGVVVATFTLGAMMGCLSCSYTSDRFGRRIVIFAGAILTLVGEVLEASSFQLAQLIIGRVILGAGVGMLSGTVPTWQSECSSSSNRGKHVVLDGLFISIGYVLQAWINLGFYQIKTGSASWRPPIAIPIFFSLILSLVILAMPESPRWLSQQGRMQEARNTLAALKGLPEDDTSIIDELSSIERSLEQSGRTTASLGDMLKMGQDRLLYRFCLCILLQFFQQMSGGNLISVYSTVIFQDGLHMDSETSRILSGGTLTWKLLSCFVGFFAIDRLGRRFVLMVSGTGMATCMMGLAIATSFPHSNFGAQVASVLFVFLFNFFIPIGFLGANFLYCTEVAPTKLRVAMSSISTANHWLWNFAVTMITPVAINTIGYQYYIVFTCIGFCIPISVYFFYPETMGRSLEEIDLIFRNSPSVFSTVRYARENPHLAVEQDLAQEKGEISHEEKV